MWEPAMRSQKIIYILRHAKAEVGTTSQDDHARTLMERGVEAASNMGKYLVRHGILPDLVLCSTAERASQTWEHVQEVYASPPQVEYSEKLYLASGGETINLIGKIPETVGKLLVVGHNPGLHQLCLKLAKTGDEKLMDLLFIKFPTCTFAAIALGNVAWNDIAFARGELKLFVTPKMLAGNVS